SASGQVTRLGDNTWSSSGPSGGAVAWFAVVPSNPNLIYAHAQTPLPCGGGTCGDTTSGSMFKSIDGGVTWAIADSAMPNRYVDAMAFDPTNANTIYASARDIGSYNDSVFKSTNGGLNWTAINNGLPNGLPVSELRVDPLTP